MWGLFIYLESLRKNAKRQGNIAMGNVTRKVWKEAVRTTVGLLVAPVYAVQRKPPTLFL